MELEGRQPGERTTQEAEGLQFSDHSIRFQPPGKIAVEKHISDGWEKHLEVESYVRTGYPCTKLLG